MSDDWKAELEKMKKKTEEDRAKENEREKELRKKYEGDKEKLGDLIESQLKPVAETFKDESLDKTDQPQISKSDFGVSLNLPIVSGGSHYEFRISFAYIFTDNGYAVEVRKGGYDHVQDRTFTTIHNLEPPITVEKIQSEIRAFINDRNFAIKMLEHKARNLKRKFG